METIYCISGLGADERAFSKLQLPGYQLKVIAWLMPEPEETIQHYAARMIAGINEENPVLMGLSFGGMICTEIAKQVPVKKVILISSIKSYTELPVWMKAVARLRLHKLIPLKSTRLTQPVQNLMLGAVSAEEKKIAAEYRRKVNIRYTNWAIHQALNWKNDWIHPDTIHIHGDHDRMFPIKKIKASHTINKGGHFMIMSKANEISSYLYTVLKQH